MEEIEAIFATLDKKNEEDTKETTEGDAGESRVQDLQ